MRRVEKEEKKQEKRDMCGAYVVLISNFREDGMIFFNVIQVEKDSRLFFSFDFIDFIDFFLFYYFY